MSMFAYILDIFKNILLLLIRLTITRNSANSTAIKLQQKSWSYCEIDQLTYQCMSFLAHISLRYITTFPT